MPKNICYAISGVHYSRCSGEAIYEKRRAWLVERLDKASREFIRYKGKHMVARIVGRRVEELADNGAINRTL